MSIHIVDMIPEHWNAVARIYAEGIATGHATFQKDVPSWEEWDGSHLKKCRFVAVNTEGVVMGWAALTPVSGRCVYVGVAEVSVYVSTHFTRHGIGKMLMTKLIESAEASGLWTLQSGIFPENVGSVRLHEMAGFRLIGRRERIGKMDNVWRDTLLMERRSQNIGID